MSTAYYISVNKNHNRKMGSRFCVPVFYYYFMAMAAILAFLSDYTAASHSHPHLFSDTSRASSSSSVSSVSPLDLGTCHGVKEMFAQKIGTLDAIPKAPIKDGMLSVCEATQHHHHRLSCCTESMETSFIASAETFVRKQMRTSNSKLKNRIRQSLRVYLEHLEKSMGDSYNQTTHQLSNLLKIPKEAHGKALDTLFTKLREFVKSSHHHNLQDIIHEFFANLFPSVYDHSVSNHAKSRSQYDSFSQCLTNFHKDIRPFGDVPMQLAKRIKFAFHRAKAVVDTLEIMLHSIHVAESVSIDKNCKKAIAKLQYCSMCSGYLKVKPCRGFCINVMRGCFPNIAELSPSWDSLVVAFENLNLGLLRKNNVQEILGYFSGNVTNAVLHAMEDVPRIYQEVIRLCEDSTRSPTHSGSPKRFSTAKGLAPSPSHHISYTSGSLRKDILTLIAQLDNSKGFLTLLADGLCKVSEIFDTDMRSKTCWNGTSVGRYTREVPEAKIIIQAQFNKEVKVNLYPKHKLLEVKDTLISQRRNLSLLFNEELMIGDQSLRGSGAGEFSAIIGDDEDFSSIISGSGSGEGPEEDSSSSSGRPQTNRLTPTRNPNQGGNRGDGVNRGDGNNDVGVNSGGNDKADKGGSYNIAPNNNNNIDNNNNNNNNDNNDKIEDGGSGAITAIPTISWVTLLLSLIVSSWLSRSLLSSSRSHGCVL